MPTGADLLRQGALILGVAAVLGVLLASIQTPLYRVLEGYVGWRPPTEGIGRLNLWARALQWSQRRQLRRKQTLSGRYDLVELGAMEASGLRDELKNRLDEVRADRELDRYAQRDRKRGPTQLGLLREQLRRYPVSDQQVVPTRLGNAIRRLEEYGYDRYRLDSQTLWYELTAVAPERAVRDVERSRIAVDFMVCLLVGHAVLALMVGATAPFARNGPVVPLLTGLGLLLLARVWYMTAVSATDDWAAAVRSLVNLGRKPLAAGLGLRMPETLSLERDLWGQVSRLSARPFDPQSTKLDTYRAANGQGE